MAINLLLRVKSIHRLFSPILFGVGIITPSYIPQTYSAPESVIPATVASYIFFWLLTFGYFGFWKFSEISIFSHLKSLITSEEFQFKTGVGKGINISIPKFFSILTAGMK